MSEARPPDDLDWAGQSLGTPPVTPNSKKLDCSVAMKTIKQLYSSPRKLKYFSKVFQAQITSLTFELFRKRVQSYLKKYIFFSGEARKVSLVFSVEL